MKKLVTTIVLYLVLCSTASAIEFAPAGVNYSSNGMFYTTQGNELVSRKTGFNGRENYTIESFFSPSGMNGNRVRFGNKDWSSFYLNQSQAWGIRIKRDQDYAEQAPEWCSLVKTSGVRVWEVEPVDGDKNTGQTDCKRDKEVITVLAKGNKPKGYTCVKSASKRKCRNTHNTVLAEATTLNAIREIRSNREQQVTYCGNIYAASSGMNLMVRLGDTTTCDSFPREAGNIITAVEGVYREWLPHTVSNINGWSCLDRGSFFECTKQEACAVAAKPFRPSHDLDLHAPKFMEVDADERGGFVYSLVDSCATNA